MRKDFGILMELSWAAEEQSKGYLLSSINVACLSLAQICTEIYSPYKKVPFYLVLGHVMSRKSQKIVKIDTYLLLWFIIYYKICKSFLYVAVLAEEFKRLRQWMIQVWSSSIYLSNPADSISISQTLRLADEFKHIYFNL